MELIKIETNCIEVTWPYVKDFIQKPLDISMGERNIEDVYYSLIHGQQQLWVGADDEDGIFGICITEILEYPNFKALSMPFIGTKPHTIKKWFDYGMGDDSPIIKWARELGIKRIEGYARDGWLRLTQKYNFKKYYTVITRDI
jgi:hypothetical protein|tara:strand:+ start:1355 stop:1783 length:429 start_codon:yes stop_codon:yes gene_type:complete